VDRTIGRQPKCCTAEPASCTSTLGSAEPVVSGTSVSRIAHHDGPSSSIE
jgi:hypothetical protein